MSKTQLLKLLAFWMLTSLVKVSNAQTTISGTVSDKKSETIPGANVYLKDTYDGATTDIDGHFSFVTEEEGNQVLVISFIGYQEVYHELQLEADIEDLEFQLAEEINKLDGIVISAGAFEASDEKKGVVLKPLDIATTAGATADIPGALNTLPGTQTNGESGRLFVRGGTGEETKVFIDGMLVQQFYSPSAPNAPGRSRFSPFLFKGTMFSTGGYSAEYGQALSSTLSLNSIDLPNATESNISLMTVGGDVSHSQLWDNSSLFAQVGYTNLNPYIGLVDQAYDFEKAFEAVDGILSYRMKTKKGGMLKIFGNFNTSGFIVNQFNINEAESPNHTDLTNDYYFLNATYKDFIGKKWSHRTGISFTNNQQDIIFNSSQIDDQLSGVHVKTVLENDLSDHVTLRFGGELINDGLTRDFQSDGDFLNTSKFRDNLLSSFVEADVYLSTNLVFRPGVRSEHSTLLNKSNLSPRLSMAYKTSDFAQISAAFGQYYQSPENDRLLVSSNLNFEQSRHYILNYQVINEGRIFRIEGYYKDYDNLIKFDRANPFDPQLHNNLGDGYAKGVDFFWRDSDTFKNVDYWISYSFLDTRRDFQDFPTEAIPTFASKHNFSAVYKHFITSIRTQMGFTYSFTSGRPYNDPNMEGFNHRLIPGYHDLSFNAAFLYRQNVIFYTSITNLTGRDNIFGYQYANAPNNMGQFERVAVGQPAKRFYFLGVFITLSKDKNKNQLENL